MASLPNLTYTDQFIQDGQSASISVRKLFDTQLITDANHPDHYYRAAFGDFFLDHWEDLSVAAEPYLLPQIFFYQPKTVSLQLYGTTELWLSLLRINGMKNITEFHRPLILVYNAARVRQLMDVFMKREGR